MTEQNKKIRTLAAQIKRVIGLRVLICSVLAVSLILLLTVYDVYLGIHQWQSRINENLKPLEDFTIGQLLINNPRTIQVKLTSFNKQNTEFQVSWEPMDTLTEKSSIHWSPPLSWYYDYQLGNIAGYEFGYFKVKGSILDNKLLIYDLAVRVFLLIIFLVLRQKSYCAL